MQHLKMPFFVMVVPCLIQLIKTLICRILVLCPHPLAFLDSLIVHILISCSLFIDTANLHVDLENTKKKKTAMLLRCQTAFSPNVALWASLVFFAVGEQCYNTML